MSRKSLRSQTRLERQMPFVKTPVWIVPLNRQGTIVDSLGTYGLKVSHYGDDRKMTTTWFRAEQLVVLEGNL